MRVLYFYEHSISIRYTPLPTITTTIHNVIMDDWLNRIRALDSGQNRKNKIESFSLNIINHQSVAIIIIIIVIVHAIDSQWRNLGVARTIPDPVAQV